MCTLKNQIDPSDIHMPLVLLTTDIAFVQQLQTTLPLLRSSSSPARTEIPKRKINFHVCLTSKVFQGRRGRAKIFSPSFSRFHTIHRSQAHHRTIQIFWYGSLSFTTACPDGGYLEFIYEVVRMWIVCENIEHILKQMLVGLWYCRRTKVGVVFV